MTSNSLAANTAREDIEADRRITQLVLIKASIAALLERAHNLMHGPQLVQVPMERERFQSIAAVAVMTTNYSAVVGSEQKAYDFAGDSLRREYSDEMADVPLDLLQDAQRHFADAFEAEMVRRFGDIERAAKR